MFNGFLLILARRLALNDTIRKPGLFTSLLE
jgi:hypothetical protein